MIIFLTVASLCLLCGMMCSRTDNERDAYTTAFMVTMAVIAAIYLAK